MSRSTACRPRPACIVAGFIASVIVGSAKAETAPLGVYLGAECRGAAAVDQYENWLGRKPQRALDFLANETWDIVIRAAARSARCWQPTGLAMTFSVPMLPADKSTSLSAGAAGEYDDYFRRIGEAFVKNGQADAVIRLGWEFNYGWYRWAAKNSPEAWKSLWRNAVTAMRSVPGQRFRFDWCPAVGYGQIDPTQAYPGDDYVDIIGMDLYNQSWISPDPSPEELWNFHMNQKFGLKWHRDFATAHGKPMSFPEWGTGRRPDGHGRGDDPYFVERMADWISKNNVAYHNYWDYVARDINAKLSNGQFPGSAEAFKSHFARP